MVHSSHYILESYGVNCCTSPFRLLKWKNSVVFRTVLDNAVRRLESICQEWLHIQSSVNDLPPEASELISAAVGQTQLLLRSKFNQFRDLINKCEKSLAGETEKPVTCSDLEGFWDMVFIQV